VVSLFLHIGCLCGVSANLDVACGHSLALLHLPHSYGFVVNLQPHRLACRLRPFTGLLHVPHSCGFDVYLEGRVVLLRLPIGYEVTDFDVHGGDQLALLRLWLGLVGARCLLRLPQVFELTNHAFHRTKDNIHPVKRRKR
jgi:hypothetical protein